MALDENKTIESDVTKSAKVNSKKNDKTVEKTSVKTILTEKLTKLTDSASDKTVTKTKKIKADTTKAAKLGGKTAKNAKSKSPSKASALKNDTQVSEQKITREFVISADAPLTQEEILMAKTAIGFKQKTFSFYFWRISTFFILIALFLLPLSISTVNLFEASSSTPLPLFCFNMMFVHQNPLIMKFSFHFIFYGLYFIPLAAILLIITLFIERDTTCFCKNVILIALSIYIICFVVCINLMANTIRWFNMLPSFIYICYFIAVAYHISLTTYTIHQHRKNKPEYEFIKKIKEEEKNSEEKKGFRISIKIKVAVTILATILIIMGFFTFLILRDYHKMITEAVSDIGRAQAEQTAAVYDTADGKYEKIKKFFDEQREANQYSNSPYERIDIIISDEPGQFFLEDMDVSTAVLPDYKTFAYTTGRPARIADNEKSILSDQAKEYIKRYKNGTYLKTPVFNKETGTCKYIHPVTFTRKAGSKLVGFSIVTYREEVLMRAYFKTKVFVFTLVVFFLYASIFVTILLTHYITTPLLYLRSKVRYASGQLSEIVESKGKLNTENLVFEQDINSHDELKDLSAEICDLISLIRGVIPYISFSTLKYADKESDTKKSYSRELCFLFTDIRGFTSLCEDRPPKEIVSLLNHYLDLETEIIIQNGGEVDKFVGDEMMAFFAGPKKEYNACKAAMEIRTAMRLEQENSIKDGSDFISMGIGINTGRVTFGPVGSKNRMDFTSIGDTVNLAARLESANKAYGSKSIISEAVYEKLKNSFICRELDFITVKGKTEPVRIYEILQKKDEASDKIMEIKDLFEAGLDYYRMKDWDKAEESFRECNTKYNDMPSIVFLDRIMHFKFNPPAEDWDGVFTLKVK